MLFCRNVQFSQNQCLGVRQNITFLRTRLVKNTTFRHFLPVPKIVVISKSGPRQVRVDDPCKTVNFGSKPCQNSDFMTKRWKLPSSDATNRRFWQSGRVGVTCPGFPLNVKRWGGPISRTRAITDTVLSIIPGLLQYCSGFLLRGFSSKGSKTVSFTKNSGKSRNCLAPLRRVGQ